MTIKRFAWMAVALASLGIFGGCAKDRTIEDYHNELVEQAVAEIDALEGSYRGMLYSSVDHSVIGALSVFVEPDRITTAAGSDPEEEQMAVLKITVTLTGGGTTRVLTFENGGYDRSAKQFKAEATVTGRGNAEISGTFSGDVMTGVLEADGYPDRGGEFQIVRGAPMPSLSGVHTRAQAEDQFLFNTFSGTPIFPGQKQGDYKEDNTVEMTILQPSSIEEQDLMDEITPYRYVDVAIYVTMKNPDGTTYQVGGVFSKSVWDIRAKTLTGMYTLSAVGALAPTELKLQCNQSGTGWSCQEFALTNGNGLMFTVNFLPGTVGAPSGTQAATNSGAAQ